METLWLQRPSGDIPWGFRLQGGREFAEPLSVQRVTPGTVAANCLSPGDVILKIGNVNATNITHNEAQEVITGASNILQLTIKKASTPSAPLSPVASVPQYSSRPPLVQSQHSYDQQDKYPPFPDYRVGSAYQDHDTNVNSSDRYNYALGSSANDPFNMRQFEQTPPISGYSTLPARSANRQNNESFRPVQQQGQNKYPYKSTSGIQLQMNPPNRDDYQNSYNERSANYSQSQPMSPVQYMNGDSPYQRQTSVGSNRNDTNSSYPQPYFKKPTPFSPSYNQNESNTPPPQLQRQTSQGTVHESTITPGFKPGTFLPRSDDAPPPPPPPTNYQPEQYRRPAYDQDAGRSQYQRQPSQPTSYDSSPYDQRSNEYNQYQNRQNQGMYVDTSNHPAQQYDRQGSRPFEHDSTPPHYQRQPSNPQYYDSRNESQSIGSQPPTPQQYGSPYTTPQPYGRQQSREQQQAPLVRQSSRDQQPQFGRQSSREQQSSYGRQTSREQHLDSPYQMSPPGSNTINSFDDILSPFEHFQNSNYCDKLFARDNRGDVDSGVDLNSDTPRSNQSSNMSYSPPQPYSTGYSDRGQPQTLLRPAPQAPPPPSVTPPPPPPPPPPSDWAPTPKRKVPALQNPAEMNSEQQMPDKVLNTMLKNQGTQKPFAYLPSGTDLKEFKERARQRRQPRPVMPRGYVGPPVDDDDTPAEPQRAQVSKTKPGASPNPDTGVYKHAQYNSPLRMYSSDTAKEQFNIQTGGKVDVTGVNSTPERRPSDIKDSEVYKMIQAADAKGYKPKKPRDPLLRHNSADDEMRFTGLHTKADIPSKAFQRLHKIAGADNTNVSQNSEGNQDQDDNEEPQRIGNYDEASIRYRGNHIPSPSFRLLQTIAKEDELRKKTGSPSGRTATDSEDDGLPDKLNEEDMVDKRYTGGHIPSKSFKALQMFMDDDKNAQSSEGEGGGPKIKVITRARSPKVAPKPDRPVNSPVPAPQDAPSTDF